MTSPQTLSTWLQVRRRPATCDLARGDLRSRSFREQHRQPWIALAASAYRMQGVVTLGHDDLMEALLGALTESEREGSVVYLALEPLRAGEVVHVPGLEIRARWDAALAFVDREPMANWTHGARYVLLSRDTGEVESIEARLPPFGPSAGRKWRVARKPVSVPEAALPELR